MSQTPKNGSLAHLKASPTNPRRITKKRLAMLAKSIGKFGDLGGVIFNRQTGNLVGGHQRVEAFNAAKATDHVLHLTRQLEQPTANGTTAEGYIDVGGERFSYREVSWDEKTERLANLAANKSAGYFDTAALAETLKGIDAATEDLSLTMFDAEELAGYLPTEAAFAPAPQPEAAPTQEAAAAPSEALPDAPQRLRGATQAPGPQKAGDAPHAEALEQPNIKQVSLYFREPDHAKFVELIDALKGIFNKSNVSDVVLEAVKRVAITAAFK